MEYSLDLLSEILIAHGMPEDRARKAADIVLSASIAAGITTSKAIESVNRDAHIYKLRGMRTVSMEPMTAVVIASRVGLCRQEVFKALNRHLRRRRAVIRVLTA